MLIFLHAGIIVSTTAREGVCRGCAREFLSAAMIRGLLNSNW
jgi:hypothetical protein